MDLKNNKLIIICFLSSLTGIALIYVAAIRMQPATIELKEINSNLVGKAVTTEGFITYKSSHPAGHFFLTISENDKKVQVPLFAGFMSELKKVGIGEKDFKSKARIVVTGTVDEYRGQLQIVPRKVEDIKIIRD